MAPSKGGEGLKDIVKRGKQPCLRVKDRGLAYHAPKMFSDPQQRWVNKTFARVIHGEGAPTGAILGIIGGHPSNYAQ